ncbi:hypothetical protein TNCV_174481 [Trichonephila clavipes]|nr:hypothetical protein TNCV_174481 [Trichonephila clavipes]
MEQSTVSESPLKDPTEPSVLKDSLDSKPPVVSKPPIVSNPPILSKSPIISKSPDPPDKKTHDKKVDSLFIVLRDSGQDEIRNYETKKERIRKEGHEILGCIEDPISDCRIKGPECFGDPLMHFAKQ